MLQLVLVRHAKSSWAFELKDHDRPLGKRGRKDVVKIGKHLRGILTPQRFLSSTASRAFYTALHICDQLGLDEGKIRLKKKLYHAGAEEILDIVRNAPRCETLAIFGHNPGFTDFANLLANEEIKNIPTCGVVVISFDVKNWSDVSFGSGKLESFITPKSISSSHYSYRNDF